MRSYQAAPPARVVMSKERALPASGARSYRTVDDSEQWGGGQWTWKITNAPSLPYLRSHRIAATAKLTDATMDAEVISSAISQYVQCVRSADSGAQPDGSWLRELWRWWQQCRRIIGSQPTQHVEDGAWGLTEYVAFLLDVDFGGNAPPATLQSSPLAQLLRRQGDQWRHRVGPHLAHDDEPVLFTVEGDASTRMYWSQDPYSYAGHDDCVVELIAGHDNDGEPLIKRLPSYLVQPLVSAAWVRPFLQHQGPYSPTQIISQCLYYPEKPRHPAIALEQMLVTAHTPLVEQLAAKAVYAAFSGLGYSRKVGIPGEVRLPVDDESDPVTLRLESTQSTDIRRAKRAFAAENYQQLEMHSNDYVIEGEFAKQIAQEFARLANRQWIPLSATGLALL